MEETRLVFNTEGEPITATGTNNLNNPIIWEYTATLRINMTKLSDP